MIPVSSTAARDRLRIPPGSIEIRKHNIPQHDYVRIYQASGK
jgi:hypothetical protein